MEKKLSGLRFLNDEEVSQLKCGRVDLDLISKIISERIKQHERPTQNFNDVGWALGRAFSDGRIAELNFLQEVLNNGRNSADHD